jgi:phospholipid/cholesterol/gamma-HCH transport system substrate-binding protein
MMRRFSEMNQSRVGLVGVTIVAVLVAACLTFSKVQRVFTGSDFTARFAESGGLQNGDDVRLAGLKVGQVLSVGLDGNAVKVDFEASQINLGDRSRAAIKTANALGRKYVAVYPKGQGDVNNIPLARTDSGYSVTQALGSLTEETGRLDVHGIADSAASLSKVLGRSPTEFRSALKGVSALSRTISARDQELATLLARTSSISGVLAHRNREIIRILGNGSLLFQELDRRRAVIAQLLGNVEFATHELNGFVADNHASLRPSLRQLNKVAKLLAHYRTTIEYALNNLGSFVSGLGEAVGSGPFFQAYLQNVTAPTTLAPVLSNILGKSR